MLIKMPMQSIFRIAFILTFALVFIHIAVFLNWHLGGIRNDFTIMFVSFFDLSTDTSIPTWFSSLLLLLCAGFLFIIYKHKKSLNDRFQYHWLGLACIFLTFSIDEVATMHEVIGGRLGKRFMGEAGGLLHYSWVIFGGIFVAACALIYLKFILHLPKEIKFMFLLSMGIYFGGALGIEMFSGQYSEANDSWSLGYALWTAAEEFCEMIGISLFLLMTLEYICKYMDGLTLQIGE